MTRIVTLFMAIFLVACQQLPKSASPGLLIDVSSFEEMPKVQMRGQQKFSGPQVLIMSPENEASYKESDEITIEVLFEPSQKGRRPQMDTLKVVVRLGWFGKDITEDLLEYIEDNKLFAPSVNMSGHTGDFNFEISIEDESGALTEQTFSISVKEG
jgi:hypothetical protein